jgi:hypothetical protein
MRELIPMDLALTILTDISGSPAGNFENRKIPEVK